MREGMSEGVSESLYLFHNFFCELKENLAI